MAYAPEVAGVVVTGTTTPAYATILTPEALSFVATLVREFRDQRSALLQRRVERQVALDHGQMYDFLPETAEIRSGNWTVAPVPPALQDRRVEITGPTERKMVINALNSGASVFMVDFEDANAPSWDNMIQGQLNLYEAVRGTIQYTNPDGREYRLNEKTATMMTRPRGWHLLEKHILIDGTPAPGGIVDFGLYFFHNARALLEQGRGPYFYLPKMESHLEARLWNAIFTRAQQLVGLPHGTIRATVLIETLPAAFEMDEILYELRDHSAGLNCGRWDYIFSCIKKRRNDPAFILPDRALVTMTTHFMRSYSLLLIKTCHRRGIHAMGGMAAQIPVKSDPVANEEAMAKVRADKEREATDGHDGTWVAHPGLVPIALDAFNRLMSGPNQIARSRDDVQVSASDLLAIPEGPITESGLRTNVSVGLQYLEAWIGGNGCVPINHLMEDAATAEISRSQVWQWIRHPKGILADGRKVTVELFRQVLHEETERILAHIPADQHAGRRFTEAGRLFDTITTSDAFVEFLTLPGYDFLQ